MATLSRAATLQHAFSKGGLESVFVEYLGWEAPHAAIPAVTVEAQEFAPALIAGMKGFHIYRVPTASRPSRKLMQQVDARLAELSPERMEIFQFAEGWIWHWPRRANSGTATFDAVETQPATLPAFLAQRLRGLEITVNDLRAGITLAEVRDRVYGEFDASPVTTRFYRRFQAEHENLTAEIDGLPDEERVSYATTLLNRLMFLYFMQKKEFLNGDPRYLENTVAAVQRLRGPDRYYTVYRDALLPLFFDKLSLRNGRVADPEIESILGDVRYVNGGLFARTPIENTYADELHVPDSVFERILAFFGEFDWHLDTRPTAKDEINPEVIGYIFEQYINFTSVGKKEHGAYYTPHDVTGYMVGKALIPRILDEFAQRDSVFELLRADPDRYLAPAMLHGWDISTRTWRDVPSELLELWLGDPAGWAGLDAAAHDPDVSLPAETWVETLHRRERTDALRRRIAAGSVATVNDLITENLNSQLLLCDAIDELTEGRQIAAAFAQVSALSVFDPTCGSGAFLFAAMEVLEDVYDHLIDAAISTADQDAVSEMLGLVERQPSKRYFIRKHIAIRNLYGTDLMADAIETAKLRIFLALAACVETQDEFAPLPDLDFNLKTGNLVVGFKDADDVERFDGDFTAKSYLLELGPRISEHARLYREFTDAVEAESDAHDDIKRRLEASERALTSECDEFYADISGVQAAARTEWIATARPLHWFTEFPEIVQRGGFDVIIGNPPYVRMTQLPGYTVAGYTTARCPDLYAVCYERSLSLLHPSGRHAFIVTAAFALSEDFRPLRDVVGRRSGAEWWSTYGRIPAGLFPAHVKVRNTILILGPGDEVWTTRHHLHKTAQRGWLFPTVEHARSNRRGGEAPVRGGVATPILEKLASLPAPDSPSSGETVYVRPTAAYWFPALPGPAPVLDGERNVLQTVDGRLKKLRLGTRERYRDVVAVLAGKIAYIWWALVGDDFDVNPREADAPRALALASAGSAGWASAVDEVLAAADRGTFVSVNAGKWYFNVRWTNIREVTDVLDRIALDALGGDDSDWRALNILYRQLMRSSRDSTKGRYVTPTEYSQLLGWGSADTPRRMP